MLSRHAVRCARKPEKCFGMPSGAPDCSKNASKRCPVRRIVQKML
jgi:hypothetical protein